MEKLTLRQVVAELDRYIVRQADARRAVVAAVRNRGPRKYLAGWTGVMLVVIALSAAALGGDLQAADNIDGTWSVAKAELAGNPWPDKFSKITRLIVDGDKYTVMVGNAPDKGTIRLNPSASPKALDITGTEGPNKGKTIPAIYEWQGDTLRICYDLSGKQRPEEFKSAAGTKQFLVTYQRQKKS